MRSRSSAPAEPVPRYATTLHLVGDRVMCARCEWADLEVRFVAADLPLCENCERAGLGNPTQGEG